jgi:hypothetical protein
VLSNLLVENVVKEFVKILLSKLVVELTTMGLDDVATARGRTIGKGIVLRELNCIL